MKRGNVSSREGRKAEKFIGIRASVNGYEAQPMRVRGHNAAVPAVGEVFRAHPTSVRKAMFARQFRVVGIVMVDGIEIFNVESFSEAQ